MRAGAREFLTLPLISATIAMRWRGYRFAEGLIPRFKTARKLFVFLGAKGGCGVTTIAANFAVSWRRSHSNT